MLDCILDVIYVVNYYLKNIMKVLKENKIFGFTLIELLVVIGILAVLAVAVILVLKSYFDRTDRAPEAPKP